MIAQESLKDVLQAAQQPDVVDFIVKLRRELHQYPELLFELPKTSAIVRKALDDLGVKYTAGIAKTGVVATLGTGQAPVVALRADMDALPLEEDVDSPFRSTHPGKMHACGHDGHTSMLLGAAKLLKAREADLQGTVKLVFQPAEEGGAGALRMAEQGALEGVEAVFGFHVNPGTPTGFMASRPGTLLAAAGQFEIQVTGRGGHGAMPHLAADPIVAAAHIVTSLQAIVSRETDPLQSRVVSVTRISGGFANNVIPEAVTFGGTYRAFTVESFQSLRQRILELVTMQAAVHRCNASVDFQDEASPAYPPTINDEGAYQFATRTAARMLGPEAVSVAEPIMGGEDFSFFLERVPGCMLWLGIRNETLGSVHTLHSPQFQLDENALPIGAAMHVALAEEYLKQKAVHT